MVEDLTGTTDLEIKRPTISPVAQKVAGNFLCFPNVSEPLLRPEPATMPAALTFGEIWDKGIVAS